MPGCGDEVKLEEYTGAPAAVESDIARAAPMLEFCDEREKGLPITEEPMEEGSEKEVGLESVLPPAPALENGLFGAFPSELPKGFDIFVQ